MSMDLDWARTAAIYLEDKDDSNPVIEVLRKLQYAPPEEITVPLDHDAAASSKAEATAFMLAAIRDAVADHSLRDTEVRSLVHMQRVLRIQEGELLERHPQEVADLLCKELARVLKDREIEPGEALHKVKLQEVLGLSYDEFISLTAPEIERAMVETLHTLERSEGGDLSARDVAVSRRTLKSLNTLYKLNAPRDAQGSRSGYLYLLVNPAMPGLIKVGRTSRAPEERVAELTSATGVPAPFILLYDLFVSDAPAAEAWVHEELSQRGAQLSTDRECFSVPASEAVKVMMQAREIITAD